MPKNITKNAFTKELLNLCKNGLLEDDAINDITSDCTIENTSEINFKITSREKIVLCGVDVIDFCFDELAKSKKFKNSNIAFKLNYNDGDLIKSGDVIAQGFGDSKLVFAAERVLLNILQHLSGISTLTNAFVNKLNNEAKTTVSHSRGVEKSQFFLT